MFRHGIEASAAVMLLSLAAALTVVWSADPAAAAGMKRTITMVAVEPKGGTTPDRLRDAASPVALRVEVHDDRAGTSAAGTARAIDLPPGLVVKLRPSGRHLMLVGMKERLVEYGSFPMTLTFERAGSVEIEVQIEEAGAAGSEHQ